MTNSTRDGLGYEELAQPGSQVASAWLTGSVVTPLVKAVDVVASTALSGTSVLATTVTAVNVSGTTAVRSALVNAVNVIGTTALSGTSVLATTVTAVNVSGTTAVRGSLVSAGNATVAGSADIPSVYDNTGSPYAQGNVYTTFTAETIISGGMWVTVSGAAGGASVKARAAAASTVPLGVATATASSGATVNVLTRGVHYFVAEASLNNGVQFAMGAAASLNAIKAAGAGTGRGLVLAGAGSEAQALVYLF